MEIVAGLMLSLANSVIAPCNLLPGKVTRKKKEKKKEGREDQLWWLENEGGEREFQQHLR